jgi:hypothetical protein
MTILTNRRARKSGVPQLAKRIIGNATVLHLPDRLSAQAQALAIRVAKDPHYDLVVLDLPPGAPVTLWDAVAEQLPKSRRGVRIVLGGRPRETTALAGQWLAERSGRSVVAPDGVVLTGAGGSLFVHSGRGTGWVRFQPGRPAEWEAKRFPRPRWDSSVFAEEWPTSARGVAEPVPGGMWIRPSGLDARQRAHRRLLIEAMPCQHDLVTVAVGCPDAAALSLDDVARLWVRLTPEDRGRVRIVHFGPVATPRDVPLGQALADCLDERVACYNGIPVEGAPDVYTLDHHGGLGRPTFVRELGYLPGKEEGEPEPPTILGHRAPVPGLPEISPAVYWYAPDAVIEVVQSGLWIRPPFGGANGHAIRSAPSDRAVQHIVYDDQPGQGGERMRMLATDVLARLDPALRQASRVLPANAVPAGPARIHAGGQAPAGLEPAAFVDEPEVTSVLPAPRPADLSAELSASPFAQPAIAVPGYRLESGTLLPDLAPASEPSAAVPVVDVEPPTPVQQSTVDSAEPADDAMFQPTPVASASALLPARGIDEERAWLRRTLGQDYGTHANAVARVLSVHPGFHGALNGSSAYASADVVTDAVAVRLHVATHGEAIDLALRTATVGPHVPFARCVVSGLGKLPSHRGATIFAASPTPAQLRLYESRDLVTEWGFIHALTSPCAKQTGNTDVLIWSVTGRRTKLLESDECRTEDRVVFVPGTSFTVLRIQAPTGDRRGQIVFRELAAGEIDAAGRVDSGRAGIDDLALSSLDAAVERWAGADQVTRVNTAAAGRFGALPGLL